MTFDGALKGLLAFLKQPLKYALGIGIVAAVALFAPDSVIDKTGLLKYRNQGKQYLGVALLLCVAIAIGSAIGFGARKYRDYAFLFAGKKRLHRLTVEEKQILQGYIESQSRSSYLPINSGIVNGLASEGIIYRSSSLSRPGYGAGAAMFAHNIQPWAWDYLNKHPDLLS